MNEESTLGAVVRLVIALPVVLGLVYLVLKYGVARRYAITSGNRRLRLVEQLPLGPKATLSLIALGRRHYLLAHQDNSIHLIKELGELPDLEEEKTSSVFELTPQTIEEYDQQRQSGNSAGTAGVRGFHAALNNVCLPFLKSLALRAKKGFASRISTGGSTVEKGEEKS